MPNNKRPAFIRSSIDAGQSDLQECGRLQSRLQVIQDHLPDNLRKEVLRPLEQFPSVPHQRCGAGGGLPGIAQ